MLSLAKDRFCCISGMISKIKTVWRSIDLPGYRELPDIKSCNCYSYENLPTINQRLNGTFNWLKKMPIVDFSIGDADEDSDRKEIDAAKLFQILAKTKLKPPDAFAKFISEKKLYKRIRSAKDCYLDLADRVIKTSGSYEGYLLHFMSEQQWCWHWYIHIQPTGEHFVAVSRNAYCFEFDDEIINPYGVKDCIEIDNAEIFFCAATFEEFIYRFFIENEIWFAVACDKRSLTRIERSYVEHYKRLLNSM